LQIKIFQNKGKEAEGFAKWVLSKGKIFTAAIVFL
jgi:hypothetical protein